MILEPCIVSQATDAPETKCFEACHEWLLGEESIGDKATRQFEEVIL